MTSQVCTMCYVCARFKGDGTCEAYPKGIPKEIIVGRYDHRDPYDGDNGVLFKAGEGITPETLDLLGYPPRGDAGSDGSVPGQPAQPATGRPTDRLQPPGDLGSGSGLAAP